MNHKQTVSELEDSEEVVIKISILKKSYFLLAREILLYYTLIHKEFSVYKP
jgi:hypothetical protein